MVSVWEEQARLFTSTTTDWPHMAAISSPPPAKGQEAYHIDHAATHIGASPQLEELWANLIAERQSDDDEAGAAGAAGSSGPEFSPRAATPISGARALRANLTLE